MTRNFDFQLREACQITRASWAVLAEREGGHWLIRASHRLPKSKQSALTRFLAQESVDSWLAIALKGDAMRSASLPPEVRLEANRLFVYPIADDSQVVLVGADQQSASAQRVWRLVAGLIQPPEPVNTNAENYLPSLQSELPFDLPRSLEHVLANFLKVVNVQGAWLAIRRGDTLDILAQSNDPQAVGLSLTIESNRLLRRMNRTLTEIAAEKDNLDWEHLPPALRKSKAKYWLCLPLVIGHRLIGAVALWYTHEFDQEEWKRLRELAKRISPSVEVIVTFNEMTGYLRRLALLNDFALTVSSAQNLDQIARRVFGLLSRSFSTELIALYISSMDGRLVREYGNRDGKFSTQSTALAGHFILPFLNGRILRLSESTPGFKPVYPNARSRFLVPLKYRGQTIGLLLLEIQRLGAFSQYD